MTGRPDVDGLLGSVTLEKLDGSLVLFGSVSCFECSEIPPFARPGVLLSRVEPILTRLQLSNHCTLLMRPRLPVDVPKLEEWLGLSDTENFAQSDTRHQGIPGCPPA